ncbi:MAG TPA: hypothetical protein VF889_03630 [Bacteroidota bacterium]
MDTGIRLTASLLLCASCILGGCSYTAPVTFEHAPPGRGVFTLARLNQRLAGKHVLLRMRDSSKMKGEFIVCSAAYCRIVREDDDTSLSPAPVNVPVQTLGSIEYKDHAMGALIGFLGGAGAGYMIFTGSSAGSYTASHERPLGASEFLWGGLTGCILGWLTGQSCVYQLPDSSF